MKSNAPVQQTDFKNLKLMRRGKVRDVYDLGDKLLIVVTDRISAFDVIMKDTIPQKGVVLNTMASFWFDQTRHIIRNHVITTDVEKYPEPCKAYRDELQGRSMLVEKAKSLPVECIVRGYISGSGWNEYQKTGAVCGVVLPQGLKESDKLPEPIFTPTTKAEQGHDQNITFDEMCKTISKDVAEQVRATSIKIYQFAQTLAASKGIIIADTKMEFGIKDGELILIDELLSPDSSRFWPADQYKPGDKQPSYDKQFLRDYLLAIKWD
ncbi:MAG TPA: phosphoribosylaminoimidazolesuccinocarboxamide synthase, partial [bacterium]|nr:phosphoribosylaminoimidazolesuccinocarboxamide synthase [bacterium]